MLLTLTVVIIPASYVKTHPLSSCCHFVLQSKFSSKPPRVSWSCLLRLVHPLSAENPTCVAFQVFLWKAARDFFPSIAGKWKFTEWTLKCLSTSQAWTLLCTGGKCEWVCCFCLRGLCCTSVSCGSAVNVFTSLLLLLLFNYSAGLRAVDGDGWQGSEGEAPV